jgi:hypothetical protein
VLLFRRYALECLLTRNIVRVRFRRLDSIGGCVISSNSAVVAKGEMK